MEGRVHSIETLGTVDGPGIRYVVFLQGCPMRCLYCHNPDTWDENGGTIMSAYEILDEFEKYRPYLKHGGITLTGGEPLLQIDFVIEIFKKAKESNIHTCLDTSGVLYESNIKEKKQRIDLAKYTDLVLLDIKHINDRDHKILTGHSNRNIIAFARFLDEKGVNMWIRHVVVPGITDKEDDLYKLGEFMGTLKHVKALDVLPYHRLGNNKYKRLGMKYKLEYVPDMTIDDAERAKIIILKGYRHERKKQRLD